LFEALAGEEDPSTRKFLLQLLSAMGNDVAKGAVKRLNDSSWYVVRNMIYLLREAGGSKYAPHVRKFVKDKNKKICMEALRTLLHFKSRDAYSYIKLYLKTDDIELRQQAVKFAGMYRCVEAVPLLLDMLKKMDVLGTEAYDKIPVVKALGEIGDPRAIEVLMKIMKSRTFLYRAALGDLKVEIFRSLRNYPRESVFPLLAIGINSKNDEIRAVSEKLLKEGGLQSGS